MKKKKKEEKRSDEISITKIINNAINLFVLKLFWSAKHDAISCSQISIFLLHISVKKKKEIWNKISKQRNVCSVCMCVCVYTVREEGRMLRFVVITCCHGTTV